MKNMVRLGAAALLAASVWAGSSFARGPGCEGKPMKGMGGGMRGLTCMLENDDCMSRLGITEEQKKAIEAIQLGFERESIQLEAALKEARLNLRTLMKSESEDRDALFAAMEAVGTAELNLKKAGMTAWLDARGQLTVEQRARCRKEMCRMRQGKMDRREGAPFHGKQRGPECGKGRAAGPGCGMGPGAVMSEPEEDAAPPDDAR